MRVCMEILDFLASAVKMFLWQNYANHEPLMWICVQQFCMQMLVGVGFSSAQCQCVLFLAAICIWNWSDCSGRLILLVVGSSIGGNMSGKSKLAGALGVAELLEADLRKPLPPSPTKQHPSVPSDVGYPKTSWQTTQKPAAKDRLDPWPTLWDLHTVHLGKVTWYAPESRSPKWPDKHCWISHRLLKCRSGINWINWIHSLHGSHLGIGHCWAVPSLCFFHTFWSQLAPAILVQRGKGTVVRMSASNYALLWLEKASPSI